MLPTEQPEFFATVNQALAGYMKFPTPNELEAWWRECRGLSLDDVKAAIHSHRDDPDRGERAPRPIDITRRMRSHDASKTQCAARDANTRCAYPGLFSDGTAGEGPWWCAFHRVDRVGPAASEAIRQSLAIPFEEARAQQAARALEQAQRAPGVVNTAHEMALRIGNRPTRGFGAQVPDSLRRAS